MVDPLDPDRRRVLTAGTAMALAGSDGRRPEAASDLFTGLGRRSVPADVGEIVTAGHSRVGIGAARYRFTTRRGATAFRARIADGRWFELSEEAPDVTMFGALVDDRTDDTDAWAAAMGYVVDARVDLSMPAGNSRVRTLPIRVPAGRMMRIRGAGKLRSAIVPFGSETGALVLVEARDIDAAFELRDLAIVDPSARRRRTGLRIERCARFSLADVRVAGWDTGLELLGALAFTATNITIADNNTGRYFGRSSGTPAIYPNLVAFEGGDIRGNRIGTVIAAGNQIVDTRVDMEANGVAADERSGAVIIQATMGEEVASRGRRDDGPCQYVATGCWFEQNLGQAFAARGAFAADIVLDRCTFVANEGGRDILVEKVGGVALLDDMCISPASIVSLDARSERVEGGLYAGTLRSTSAAAHHRTRVAALDRAGWSTSHRLWHRDAPGNDLAWFTDQEAANGATKDSTAWKYGDGQVLFRHGAAGGRASLTLAPDAIGFLGAVPVGRRRIGHAVDAIADAATRGVVRDLIAALEALGLVERGPPRP